MVQTFVAPEQRVEDVLRRYKQGGIPGMQYQPNVITIGPKTYSAQDTDPGDFETFVQEMAIITKRQRHPMVADILARGAPRLWDLVRMVNHETKNGYGGIASRGDKLVINPLEVRDLGRAGGFPGTAAPNDWLETPTALGPARLWPPTSGTIDLTISSLAVLGHVYFGFVDPVPDPKVSGIQLILDSDPWPEEVVDWNWREATGDNENPVYELRAPWLLRNGASYRVNVRYYTTGEDRLQPIGFSVKRARDIIASLAS